MKRIPVFFLGAMAATAFWLLETSGSACYAQSLRYRPASGATFAYDFEITVESTDNLTIYKGITRYTVGEVSEEQVTLNFVGGLPEQTRAKASAANRGGPRFGPPGFPGPPPLMRPPGFFGRQEFSGRVIGTRNQVTLAATGGVLAMVGESQLPYLLGNVSLMPFEILPAGNESKWKYDAGISIEQKSNNSFRPPFGPLAQQDQGRVQQGQEVTDYEVLSRDAQKVVVKKTTLLKSPKVEGQTSFEQTGTGTWTYSLTTRMPLSLDYKQKLVIVEGLDQTTFPISIKYQQLSPDQLAKMDEESKKQLAELEKKAKANQAEHQRKMEEDKKKASLPLTPQEKQEALATLAGNEMFKQMQTLRMLKEKSGQSDPEIVAALQKLLTNPNQAVQAFARDALQSWAPDLAKGVKLNDSYNSHMPVESSELEVNSTTPLFVGQILQFQEFGSFWFPGEIVELLPDGKVKVRKRGIAANQEAVVARRNLQLAPPDVRQPRQPESTASTTAPTVAASAAETGMRTWVDATGQHKIEAQYQGFADGKVKLKRADGKEIAVPVDKLSAADQQLVKKLQTLKTAPNPFE